MKLKFLGVMDLGSEWGRIEPLFKKVVDKAVHDEYDVKDLARMAYNSEIIVGVMEDDDGMPVLALAFEFIDYPSGRKAINVLAMGGSNLDGFMGLFWEKLKDWAWSQGVDWIECKVSPGMERIHQRYGLETVYRVMRIGKEKP